LAAIFARLEFAGLLYQAHLQAKVQATPHANPASLCLSIGVEWEGLAVEYICKTCRSFRRRLEAVAVKNGNFVK
jgi:hypothetical protein